MFVNSTPHRRFTQSLGLPLSTDEILDYTLKKYGQVLSAKGPTPYLFSVEPDGTAMRLWFFNDSALYFHRLLSSKLAGCSIKETSFVYQDKRGFFLLSGQNTGVILKNRASERSIGCYGARFMRSAAKEYRNRCCTNRISLLCKQLLNVFRR